MRDTDGWQASLELELGPRGGRTVLELNRHQGPLMVQRPFHPQGDESCHLYILHPPGGVVAGDQLSIRVRVKPQARALITTPAAGKLYRSPGPWAGLEQRLSLEPGAVLEWLPLETIVYDQARARLRTRVELSGDAAFVGWEIICLGLAASGKPFASGQLRQDLEVWREGRPLVLERGRYEGGGPLLREPWGLGGWPVAGTMLASGGDGQLLAAVRSAAAELDLPGRFAATLVSGVLVCRYLGPEAEAARAFFLRAWQVIRPALLGAEACPPRIWSL